MAGKIYKNDIGTLFRIDCGSDITGATIHEIQIRKPDATEVIWPATMFGTNYLDYIVVAGDLNQSGSYSGHSFVLLPSGQWRGELFKFSVYEKWM